VPRDEERGRSDERGQAAGREGASIGAPTKPAQAGLTPGHGAESEPEGEAGREPEDSVEAEEHELRGGQMVHGVPLRDPEPIVEAGADSVEAADSHQGQGEPGHEAKSE
jgi:hypothetical protein